jgi:hypothetical protein
MPFGCEQLSWGRSPPKPDECLTLPTLGWCGSLTPFLDSRRGTNQVHILDEIQAVPPSGEDSWPSDDLRTNPRAFDLNPEKSQLLGLVRL